jgi:hypothetical protein
VLSNVVDPTDVGVIQFSDSSGLCPEARQRSTIAREVLGKELQGNPTLEPRVLSKKDLAHAALPKALEHTVVTESLTNQGVPPAGGGRRV